MFSQSICNFPNTTDVGIWVLVRDMLLCISWVSGSECKQPGRELLDVKPILSNWSEFTSIATTVRIILAHPECKTVSPLASATLSRTACECVHFPMYCSSCMFARKYIFTYKRFAWSGMVWRPVLKNRCIRRHHASTANALYTEFKAATYTGAYLYTYV